MIKPWIQGTRKRLVIADRENKGPVNQAGYIINLPTFKPATEGQKEPQNLSFLPLLKNQNELPVNDPACSLMKSQNNQIPSLHHRQSRSRLKLVAQEKQNNRSSTNNLIQPKKFQTPDKIKQPTKDHSKRRSISLAQMKLLNSEQNKRSQQVKLKKNQKNQDRNKFYLIHNLDVQYIKSSLLKLRLMTAGSDDTYSIKKDNFHDFIQQVYVKGQEKFIKGRKIGVFLLSKEVELLGHKGIQMYQQQPDLRYLRYLTDAKKQMINNIQKQTQFLRDSIAEYKQNDLFQMHSNYKDLINDAFKLIEEIKSIQLSNKETCQKARLFKIQTEMQTELINMKKNILLNENMEPNEKFIKIKEFILNKIQVQKKKDEQILIKFSIQRSKVKKNINNLEKIIKEKKQIQCNLVNYGLKLSQHNGQMYYWFNCWILTLKNLFRRKYNH